MRILNVFMVVNLVFLSPVVYAAHKFQWAPIDSSDWEARPDSEWENVHAFILFRNMEINHKKRYRQLYVRWKILDEKGYDAADVTLLYSKHRDIQWIKARTIDRLGVYEVAEDDFHRKTIVDEKGLKMFQVAFSFPHVSPGCIVEYVYRQKTKAVKPREDLWSTVVRYGARAPTKKFVLTWVLCADKWRTRHVSLSSSLRMEPVYHWGGYHPLVGTVSRKKGVLEFTVKDIPAIYDEPLSPAEESVAPQLYLSYKDTSESSLEGWLWLHLWTSLFLDSFKGKATSLKKFVAENFGDSNTKIPLPERIYEWFRRNVRSLDYDGPKHASSVKNVDDLLRKRYGSSGNIMLGTLWAMREAGLNAHIAYVLDRDQSIFNPNTPRWMISCNILYVRTKTGKPFFCYPGVPFLAFGELPWYCQGTKAMVMEYGMASTKRIPETPPEKNRLMRMLVLPLDTNDTSKGKAVEVLRGQFSTSLRAKAGGLQEDSLQVVLRSLIEASLEDGKVTGKVDWNGVDTVGTPIHLSADVEIPQKLVVFGERAEISPLLYFTQSRNPFVAEERHYPIDFRFAQSIIETVTLQLGHKWRVAEVPSDTTFSNSVGICRVEFHVNSDGNVNIQRALSIHRPWYDVGRYGEVSELFRANEGISHMPVLLEKNR